MTVWLWYIFFLRLGDNDGDGSGGGDADGDTEEDGDGDDGDGVDDEDDDEDDDNDGDDDGDSGDDGGDDEPNFKASKCTIKVSWTLIQIQILLQARRRKKCLSTKCPRRMENKCENKYCYQRWRVMKRCCRCKRKSRFSGNTCRWRWRKL